jgi:Na+-driven multidrug efflux pump
LARLYRFEVPTVWLTLGALWVWPIFFYLPLIYALFREGRQSSVIAINVLGLTMNVVVNLALLPRVGAVGAVIAGAAAQWAMAAAYLVWASRGTTVAADAVS